LKEGDRCGGQFDGVPVDNWVDFSEGCDAFRGFRCSGTYCTRADEGTVHSCPYTLDGASCEITADYPTACGENCVYPATLHPTIDAISGQCAFTPVSCEE
jgi:hypothetical protein